VSDPLLGKHTPRLAGAYMEVTVMTDKLLVTPTTLHTSAGNARQRASDVEGIQEGLNKQLAGLIQSEWSGKSSGQFDMLWQKYNSGAKQMIEALRGIAQLLDNAGTAYANAEDAISRTFTA
jgi:WXG100 family type VII secretion target